MGVSITSIHEPDTYQQAVIASTERSIRVLAPAGSGKTETLGRRVGARIAAGVPAREILILTFDNQAKGAFQRTLQRLGVSGNVEIRTLNSFGLRILTQEFPDTRSRTGTVFYGPQEPLLAVFAGDPYGGQLVELFGTLKSHLFDPQDTSQKAGDALEAWLVRTYRQLVPEKFLKAHPEKTFAKSFSQQLRREFSNYEEFLHGRGVIDFEDQKLRSYALLERNPRVAELVRSRYAEVIVDEFQDINPLDQRLIEIISRDATLVITGDDDQAIYGFRWASAEHLIRPNTAFKRRFTSYELRTNYRCPPAILDRSRQLIEHNANRVPKNPISGVAIPGSITVIEHDSRLIEARQIARTIADTLATNPDLDCSDIGILTRRNAHLDELQVHLIAADIPYAIRAERDLVGDWDAVLALLDLSTALRRGKKEVVTDYRAAIGNFKWLPRAIRLEQLSHFGGLAFPEVEMSLRQANVPTRTLKQFLSALSLLRQARTIDLELTVIEERFLGYGAPGGNRSSQDAEEAESEDSSLGLLRKILAGRESTREGAIERLREFIFRAITLKEETGARVELSTYHSAKGRQWKMVVLPWVSGLSAPDPLTRKEFGELESERRLFYVAMTRAADRLIVGRPSSESKEWTSQFLHEAGLVPRPKGQPARPRQSALTTVATASGKAGSKPPKQPARPRNTRTTRQS